MVHFDQQVFDFMFRSSSDGVFPPTSPRCVMISFQSPSTRGSGYYRVMEQHPDADASSSIQLNHS